MTKSKPMTAAMKDALIADAQAAGLNVTRTSKDFHLDVNGEKRRVTPSELKGLIAEAEEMARAEALELAEQIRREEAQQALEQASEAPTEVQVSPTPAKASEGSTATGKAVILYGPPCRGEIAHLPIATSPEGDNPLIHYPLPVSTKYRTKQEAAAAGKASCARGFLAFMAQVAGEACWLVACVNERGHLEVDGVAIGLTLLEGEQADAARVNLSSRLQAKSQWLAQAV